MKRYIIHLYNTDENDEIVGIISNLSLEELKSQIKESAKPAYPGSEYCHFIGFFESCYGINFHLETLEDYTEGLFKNARFV